LRIDLLDDIVPVLISLLSYATCVFLCLGLHQVPGARRWIRVLQVPVLFAIGTFYALYAFDILQDSFMFTRTLRSLYLVLICLMLVSNLFFWTGDTINKSDSLDGG
jgi:hypothetical protein